MAPEVYFRQPGVGFPADVYSLAATLYCLLVGRPPRFQRSLSKQFKADQTRLDELRFLVFDAPLDCDPSDFRDNLPPAFSEFIIRALSCDPAQRPRSADEARAVLERVASPDGRRGTRRVRFTAPL